MLFFDAKERGAGPLTRAEPPGSASAAPDHPRWRLLEPAAVFLMIMLYIWWLRSGHQTYGPVIFLCILFSHVCHGEAPEQLGFRWKNFLACLTAFAPVLLFLTLSLLAAGILLQTRRELDLERGVLGFIGYCMWGLFQQYLLNGYFVNRLAPLWDRASHGAAAAAACFACAHTPNWFLMIVGFVAGYCCARIYLRYRNLYFLGLAHGAIGSLLYLVVPDAISHHLCVGPRWFAH
jgi:membrane protease YdiL (CAAX protease family)